MMPHSSEFINALANSMIEHTQLPVWCDVDIAYRLKVVLPEFVGKPELCLYIVHLIIRLRREVEVERSVRLFFDIVYAHQALFIQHLSSRWLISVLDTFVDYGSQEEKIQAMNVIVVFNMLKLSETERIFSRCTGQFPPQDCLHPYGKEFLWDGMQPMDLCKGDMLANMLRRISFCLEDNAFIFAVFVELLSRSCESDTLLKRIHDVNELFRRQLDVLRKGRNSQVRTFCKPDSSLAKCEAQLADILSSRSWRITAPLRRARQIFTNLRGKRYRL